MISFVDEFDPRAVCPACDGRGLRSFYRADGVPVHSTRLLDSFQEARRYPVGDVELAFCAGCGFIGNRRFDPSVHEYSTQCEESQAFSCTFNTFARSLAARVIDRYALHDKTVLEIGCGKADFLMLLCSLGNNRGIGVDPSCIPERISVDLREKIRIINELYGLQHADLDADFVCCRHTLEHIGPVGAFVDRLRANLGQDGNQSVFFEVPDAVRVLREGAFWDIYYEHCSYFSCGSLARLFRQRGFDIDWLELDYADQYVVMGGKPTRRSVTPRFDVENDLPVLRTVVEEFAARTRRALDRWHRLIDEASRQKQTVVVWGSSSKGVAFLTGLEVGEAVQYVVDINRYRQDKFMPGTGQRIVAPEFLREVQPDHVIAMNPIYREEIARDLDRLGLRATLHTV